MLDDSGDTLPSLEQVHLCLALIGYAGISGPAAARGELLQRSVVGWLDRLRPLRGHTLVWGPASYRLWWQPSMPALVVFVVHDPADDRLSVVVRAGGPVPAWDHLLDTLGCLEQEPWLWLRGNSSSLAPAIAAGFDRALQAVRDLTPEEPLPGAGRTLPEFLAERVHASAADRRLPIHVCGHGIGGALASLVALWLCDTQGNNTAARDVAWDPQRRAKLHCTAFASPTPGNPDFATYLSDRLGAELDLIINRLDHAAALWDTQALLDLPELYKPQVGDNKLLQAIIDVLVSEIDRSGVEYEHAPTRELEGRLASELPPSFVAHAEYQHLHAYVELLGLEHELDIDAILERPSGVDGGPVAQ